jgi:hypothetical protein
VEFLDAMAAGRGRLLVAAQGLGFGLWATTGMQFLDRLLCKAARYLSIS